MTDDPPDPTLSKAMAAYRSAGKLRTPQPAPRIVRLVEQPGQQATSPLAPVPEWQSNPPSNAAPRPSAPTSGGVSLMITNAQKDSLRQLGVTEDELRHMTPGEAHRRLGLSGQ